MRAWSPVTENPSKIHLREALLAESHPGMIASVLGQLGCQTFHRSWVTLRCRDQPPVDILPQ